MTWLIPLYQRHTVPIDRPVEATEEELLARPCTLTDFPTSGACDGVEGTAERALLEKGATYCVAKHRAILTCLGVDFEVVVLPKLLLGLYCRPCNSFSAKHARLNNLGTLSYSL